MVDRPIFRVWPRFRTVGRPGTFARDPVVVERSNLGETRVTRLLQDVPDTYAVPSTGPPAAVTRPLELATARAERGARADRVSGGRGSRRARKVRRDRGAGRDRQDGSSWRRRGRRSGHGMRVLRSRGTELEREFAFGVVRQLFEPPLAEADEPNAPNLLHGAAGSRPASRASGRRARRGSLVGRRSVVRDPARPVLAVRESGGRRCAVPDRRRRALGGRAVAPLSRLSAHAARGARRRARSSRPSARDGHRCRALLATVTADPSAEVIRLPPLTRAAVAQFVESASPRTPIRSFVDACLRATRGTPFLCASSSTRWARRASRRRERRADVERIGARTIGRSIRLRLGRLPEPAGRLARALAVLEQSELVQAADSPSSTRSRPPTPPSCSRRRGFSSPAVR